MKILLVTSLAYPRVGGVSTYISGLMGDLTHRGHLVHLVAYTPDLHEVYHSDGQTIERDHARRFIEPAINRYFSQYWPTASPWIRWRETERMIFETALKKLSLQDYDILHAQDPIAARALKRAKPVGVPLVVTYHNVKSLEWKIADPAKPVTELAFIQREESLSAQGADALIFPCHWAHEHFLEFHVPLGPSRIIPYGIAESPHPVPPPHLHWPPIIVCPARLVPIKGHLHLLDALEHLKRRGYPFRCWIVGDGFLKTPLMTRCREMGLASEVQFLGARHDVETLLSHADIVVLPTLHDTSPFAIIEAQGAGKAVIASRVGGVPELIDANVDGILVDPANSRELSAALARLITNPKIRWSLGQAARRRSIAHRSLTRMVSSTLEVYEAAIHHGSATSFQSSLPDVELLSPLAQHETDPKDHPTPRGMVLGRITFDNHEMASERCIVIHLVDASGVVLQTRHTGTLGHFRFEHLPIGKYGLVVAARPPISPRSTYFEVQGPEPVTIDWHLPLPE